MSKCILKKFNKDIQNYKAKIKLDYNANCNFNPKQWLDVYVANNTFKGI